MIDIEVVQPPEKGHAISSNAIVAHLGRKGFRAALTDEQGRVRLDQIRSYDANASSSVAGALTTFQRELGLPRLPERIAIAVAGLPRGDSIFVTQTRWIVSRSGLKAMLGQAPLILNDFEAEAWALATLNAQRFEPIGIGSGIDTKCPGKYCLVGITTGLGVSLFTRHEDGSINIVATEAGHAAFAPASPVMADLISALFPNQRLVVAEQLISAVGLSAIYDHLCSTQKQTPRSTSPEAITRNRGSAPLARQACDLLGEAFYSHLSNVVLTLGAWDGIIITGGLAGALRPMLASEQSRSHLSGNGRHSKILQVMPRVFCNLEHGELIGAAEALRYYSTIA